MVSYDALVNSYRTGHECIEFNSDLNKLVHEECTKELTLMDIDAVAYKRSKGRVRFIESKHRNEGFKSSGQPELLRLIARACGVLNYLLWIFWKVEGGTGFFERWLPEKVYYSLSSIGNKWEVVIVYGDAPFDNVIVHDLVANRKYPLNHEQLIRWLEFEIELEETNKDEPKRRTEETYNLD